jgi:hypothetical protein
LSAIEDHLRIEYQWVTILTKDHWNVDDEEDEIDEVALAIDDRHF